MYSSGHRSSTGGARIPVPQGGSILNTLQAADMSDRKRLPAEIVVAILDYLPVADLMRCARASRKLREMVYEDSRWVARLRSMGCWDETEARRRFEEAVKRRRETAAGSSNNTAATTANSSRQSAQSGVTLFDATLENEETEVRRQRQHQQQQQQPRRATLEAAQDGFETMTLEAAPKDPALNPAAFLDVIKNARSVRGCARQEYGKIYGALAPFYLDLVRARSHADPVVFKAFRDPERQAQMLANLQQFARSDWAAGWHEREEKLASMMNMFETAVLREFEQGYEFWDVDGRMRRYAHVLHTLNGGGAGVELFIQKHPILNDRRGMPNPLDCINRASQDDVSLEPSRVFFEGLLARLNEQSAVIGRIFPQPHTVFWAFVDKVREDVVMEYTVPLFEQAHQRSVASYLKAMSGLFEQSIRFYGSLVPPPPSPSSGSGSGSATDETTVAAKARELAQATFDPHLDTYLREELEHFVEHADAEVERWDRKLSEEHATTESFYMGSPNRQAAKKDFLSSFKKVVMMPVNVLPTMSTSMVLPFGSPFAASKPAAATTPPESSEAADKDGDDDSKTEKEKEGPGTGAKGPSPEPGPAGNRDSIIATATPTPFPPKAPDDELAAKAALMQSRLEGIRSLFSIEVALNLVHAAKASLGRIAPFMQLGGQWGGESREQCAAVFVAMLRILGGKHIKAGFDMAVGRLSRYNPRHSSQSQFRSTATTTTTAAAVAPLTTFIELVNVGDLISQMVDVFYDQQLVTARIADRNDFLDPAGLAKKKFEQMLDESVAAGLNKGIDVLMDEVDYLNSTIQQPTDYNPPHGPGSGTPLSALTSLSLSLSLSSPSPAAAAATTTGTAAASSASSPARNSRALVPSSMPAGGLDIGPSPTAKRVIELVSDHTRMLVGTTEKSMLDVFNGEVGLRLFNAVCKHLKRQRISTDGAVTLIADMNLYFDFIRSLRNQDLLAYFGALRELSQIYLIDARHAKDMAVVIADGDRFGGVFRAEEVYEFAQRRADWYQVRRDVERAMYGLECSVM